MTAAARPVPRTAIVLATVALFLNPPLTLVSKVALAAILPASFVVAISAQEWVGGATMLAGVAFAVWPRGDAA